MLLIVLVGEADPCQGQATIKQVATAELLLGQLLATIANPRREDPPKGVTQVTQLNGGDFLPSVSDQRIRWSGSPPIVNSVGRILFTVWLPH